MKNYEILEYQNRYLILSKSYISPLEELALIEKELGSKDYYGDVYFDLLMSNGFSNNRFLKVEFTKNKFNLNSFSELKNLSKNLVELTSDYYFNNLDLLEKSSLTKREKFFIQKKILIN